MSFIVYALGLILIAVTAVLTVTPFFTSARQNTHHPVLAKSKRVERWEKQKREAYTAIKEAEFDRQMGKLSERDYGIIRRKYEKRASEALASLNEESRQNRPSVS